MGRRRSTLCGYHSQASTICPGIEGEQVCSFQNVQRRVGDQVPDSFFPFIEVISNSQPHYRGPLGTRMARVPIEDNCQVVGRALEVQIFKQLALFYIQRNLDVSTNEVLNRSLLYEWASLFVGRQDIKFTFVQEILHTTVEIYSILYLHGRGKDAEEDTTNNNTNSDSDEKDAGDGGSDSDDNEPPALGERPRNLDVELMMPPLVPNRRLGFQDI
jgi:hypothetical protein